MLTIRLQRTGTKNKPSFRIVLAQAHRAASKQALEVLGHYNPLRKDFAIKDATRLKYWLDQHVNLSPTVHNLLVEKKLLDATKVQAWKAKKKETVEATSAPAPAAAQKPAAEPAATQTATEPASVEPQA